MESNGIVMKFIMGAVRHALTTAAGYLVANGTISQSQSETLIGGALVLVAIAWSWYEKQKVAKLAKSKNEIIEGQMQVIQQKTAELRAVGR